MIITLKIPYICKDPNFQGCLHNLRKEFSRAKRKAFNLSKKFNLSQKELRKELKDESDSWTVQCAIKKAEALLKTLPTAYQEKIKATKKRIRKFKKQLGSKNKKVKKTKTTQNIKQLLRKNEQNLKDLEKKDPLKIIFGGKQNFKQRSKLNISKGEFANQRLDNFYSEGEGNQKGNRKFELKNILNKEILFKPNKDNHFNLELNLKKKSKKNPEPNHYWSKLILLNEIINEEDKKRKLVVKENKKKGKPSQTDLDKGYLDVPYTVELDEHFIWISFDEALLHQKTYQKFIPNRYFALDLNPNYIGLAVVDIDKGGKKIHKKLVSYDLTDLTKPLEEVRKKKHFRDLVLETKLNNKLNHETFQVAKSIDLLMKLYKPELLFLENLSIHSANAGKGKRYNKAIHALWKRNKFSDNLVKRAENLGITVRFVDPQYSSYIGNLQYNYHDPINAALEIGRRSFDLLKEHLDKINIKGNEIHLKKDYPIELLFPKETEIKKSLINQWKEELESEDLQSWWNIFDKIKKTPKMKYRVLAKDMDWNSFVVLRLNRSIKSGTILSISHKMLSIALD